MRQVGAEWKHSVLFSLNTVVIGKVKILPAVGTCRCFDTESRLVAVLNGGNIKRRLPLVLNLPAFCKCRNNSLVRHILKQFSHVNILFAVSGEG